MFWMAEQDVATLKDDNIDLGRIVTKEASQKGWQPKRFIITICGPRKNAPTGVVGSWSRLG